MTVPCLTRRMLVLCLVLTGALSAEDRPALRLTLPPVIPAVVGQETSIYFDNVILTETPEAWEVTVEAGLGQAEPRRWTLTPQAGQTGTRPLTVKVRQGDTLVAEASSTLKIVPAAAGEGREISLLIVGDSLTHATLYPNELARLLSQPGNPRWTMLGTHRPTSAAEGVAHEGYGGWTWARFATHFEPQPDPAQRKHSSPFVFAGDPAPRLDVSRYVREHCGGRTPDYVTFLLGINDCFSANPDDPKDIDARIDAMFAQAEILLAEFRKAAPEAELAVCLTTPPNARESGFEANYKGRYHRWGWKRIQHRLVERELKHFAGREKEKIFLLPTELNLDPVDGYPENNGVHPNAAGYKQIAASIYAWLKGRLADTATRE